LLLLASLLLTGDPAVTFVFDVGGVAAACWWP
jgi:hypothetical protein